MSVVHVCAGSPVQSPHTPGAGTAKAQGSNSFLGCAHMRYPFSGSTTNNQSLGLMPSAANVD
jgi:hypothetical protein